MATKLSKEHPFSACGISYTAEVYLVNEEPLRYRIDIRCAGKKCDSIEVQGVDTHADVANDKLIAERIEEWRKTRAANAKQVKSKPAKRNNSKE